MNRFPITLSLSLVFFLSGCSMCCGPHDYDYPTFGGKHQRADARYGRVGSIFSDSMAEFGGAGADSNLTPPPEPNEQRDFDDDKEPKLEGNDPDGKKNLDGLTDPKNIDDVTMKQAIRQRLFRRR